MDPLAKRDDALGQGWADAGELRKLLDGGGTQVRPLVCRGSPSIRDVRSVGSRSIHVLRLLHHPIADRVKMTGRSGPVPHRPSSWLNHSLQVPK